MSSIATYDQGAIEARGQVNGRIRDRLQMRVDGSEQEALALARGAANMSSYLDGHELAKVVFVPGKLVSFVLAEASRKGKP